MDNPASETSESQETLTRRVFAAAEHREIPLRTITATVATVVVAGLLLVLAWVLRTDLLLVAAALFITALLAGPVAFLEGLGMRRSFATSIVFVSGVLLFCGLAYLLGEPLVSHVRTFVNEVQALAKNPRDNRGFLGHLVTRLHLRSWLERNSSKIDGYAKNLAAPALSFGTVAVTTSVRVFLIAVLSFFLLLDLPRIWRGALSMLPEHRAARIGEVAHEASTGVSGYMLGNALTSIIAGIVVFLALLIAGVQFAGLLAVWVALVDFIPIVGALLAGIPVLFVAFLHSPKALIFVAVVFVVYQQIENHVLNPIVMAKTVKLSPLLNLLAVVVGATLGGRVAGTFGTFIGALVAIPVGSALQVIIREVRHPRESAIEEVPPPP